MKKKSAIGKPVGKKVAIAKRPSAGGVVSTPKK
jgi:hypothetical protein